MARCACSSPAHRWDCPALEEGAWASRASVELVVQAAIDAEGEAGAELWVHKADCAGSYGLDDRGEPVEGGPDCPCGPRTLLVPPADAQAMLSWLFWQGRRAGTHDWEAREGRWR